MNAATDNKANELRGVDGDLITKAYPGDPNAATPAEIIFGKTAAELGLPDWKALDRIANPDKYADDNTISAEDAKMSNVNAGVHKDKSVPAAPKADTAPTAKKTEETFSELLSSLDKLKELTKVNKQVEYSADFAKQGIWYGGLVNHRGEGEITTFTDAAGRYIVAIKLPFGTVVLGQPSAGVDAVRITCPPAMRSILESMGVTKDNEKALPFVQVCDIIGGETLEAQTTVGLIGKVKAIADVFKAEIAEIHDNADDIKS